jgi:serine/threonine protein kinase
MPTPPKETIIDGKYRLNQIIGSGGMGIVYSATCLKTQRDVAIKLLNPEIRKFSKSAPQRLHREAKLVRKLDHPNICSVVDDGVTEEGTPYMVMPLLVGTPLNEILEQSGTISVERAVHFVMQILNALEAAHALKILHRDLKPENIFVIDTAAQPDTVKLLDFGISKPLETNTSADKLTRTGDLIGTVYYLAPELAYGEKASDYRSDIYAVGVIMYQMLTGCLPYVGKNNLKTLEKIKCDPFRLPRTLNESIPRPIERFIITAMSKTPSMRYDSAVTMRTALVVALSEPDIDDDPENTSEMLAESADTMPANKEKQAAKRHRLWIWAPATITILSIAVALSLYLSNAGSIEQVEEKRSHITLSPPIIEKPSNTDKPAKTSPIPPIVPEPIDTSIPPQDSISEDPKIQKSGKKTKIMKELCNPDIKGKNKCLKPTR